MTDTMKPSTGDRADVVATPSGSRPCDDPQAEVVARADADPEYRRMLMEDAYIEAGQDDGR